MPKSATKNTHCLPHPRPTAGFFCEKHPLLWQKVSPMGGQNGREVRRRTGNDHPAKEPAERARKPPARLTDLRPERGKERKHDQGHRDGDHLAGRLPPLQPLINGRGRDRPPPDTLVHPPPGAGEGVCAPPVQQAPGEGAIRAHREQLPQGVKGLLLVAP